MLLQAPAARRYATDVRDGFAVTGTVRLGAQEACAEGAAGGGRLLVAAPVRRDGRSTVRAAFGPQAPVRTLARGLRGTSFEGLRVAVGPGGQAAVVWVEIARADAREIDGTVVRRIRLARAAAGGQLGAPATVGAPTSGPDFGGAVAQVALGFDATGALTVATAEPRRPVRSAAGTIDDLHRLAVRTATDRASLSAPQVLDDRRQGPIDPELSVAADGSALLAAGSSADVSVWSRPAHGTALRRVLAVQPRFPEESFSPLPADRASRVTSTSTPESPAVVAGPEETGAVAWRTRDGAVTAVTLGPRAAVGAPRTVLPRQPGGKVLDSPDAETSPTPHPIAEEAYQSLSLALAADGRLALGASERLSGVTPTGYGAVGTLAAGLRPARRLTGPARTETSVAALLDAAGAPQVAVADEDGDLFDATLRPHGRLRSTAAVADPAAGAKAPAASLVGPRHVTVRGGRPFPLRVRCAGACDIRADVAGSVIVAGDSLAHAGTAVLRLANGDASGDGAGDRIRVHLRVSAPAALTASTLRGTLLLRRLPRLPAPRLTAVRARRAGSTAIVTFSAPAGLRGYKLFGSTGDPSLPPSVPARALGRDTYRVDVPLRPRTRVVLLTGSDADPGHAELRRAVPVPRR